MSLFMGVGICWIGLNRTDLGSWQLTLTFAIDILMIYIVFDNKKFLDYLKDIYPSQLTAEKAYKSAHLANHCGLTFMIDSGGKLSTRLYDKHDDFDFHMVNFSFLSSNITYGPS